MSKKYYAVRKGRTTGLFTSYDACKASVHCYKGAEFRGFNHEQDAYAYLGRPMPVEVAAVSGDQLVAYTDGSWDGKRKYGWGFVAIDGTGDAQSGRGYCGHGSRRIYVKCGNIAGELIAALKAMEYAHAFGFRSLLIRHDFVGVADWADTPCYTNPAAASYYMLAQRFRQNGLEVRFEKVSAHSGVWGNECAHRLARRGLGGELISLASNGMRIEAKLPDAPKKVMQSPPDVSAVPNPLAVVVDETAELYCVSAMRSLAAALDAIYDLPNGATLLSGLDGLLSSLVPGLEGRLARARNGNSNAAAYRHVPSASPSSCAGDSQIGRMLREARRGANLRRMTVAAKCGITVRDLARLERGLVSDADAALLSRVAQTLREHYKTEPAQSGTRSSSGNQQPQNGLKNALQPPHAEASPPATFLSSCRTVKPFNDAASATELHPDALGATRSEVLQQSEAPAVAGHPFDPPSLLQMDAARETARGTANENVEHTAQYRWTAAKLLKVCCEAAQRQARIAAAAVLPPRWPNLVRRDCLRSASHPPVRPNVEFRMPF